MRTRSRGTPVTRYGTASEQPDVWIEGAMHFLQEDAGEEIAGEIVAFVDRT
jgi:haloalkane dehalogenase